MARPPRLNAEYFYHPADFRNDRRVKAIRTRLGAAGYGLLLMLLEVLTDADHIRIATDEVELELLAGDLCVSSEDISGVLQAAEKVGLFTRADDGLLQCPQLNTWLEPVFEKRNRSKNTPKPALLPQAATEIGVSVAETPPVQNSTVEYSTEQKKDTSSSLRSEEVNREGPARTDSASLAGQGRKLPPEDANASAPRTRGAAAKPARKLAFSESPVATLEGLQAALTGTDYAHADLCYYHETVRNWAESKGEKKVDWLAAIRNWILRDSAEGKLKTKQGTQQVHANGYQSASHGNYTGSTRGQKPDARAGQMAGSLARSVFGAGADQSDMPWTTPGPGIAPGPKAGGPYP